MNQEQIKNWRKMLHGMIGPVAFVLPDSHIKRIKNNLQDKICRAYADADKKPERNDL